MNCVVPVGVPAPGGVVVVLPVKTTFAPNSEGLFEDDTAVLVAAGFTIWFGDCVPVLPCTSELVLAKTALIGWLPTGSAAVGREA